MIERLNTRTLECTRRSEGEGASVDHERRGVSQSSVHHEKAGRESESHLEEDNDATAISHVGEVPPVETPQHERDDFDEAHRTDRQRRVSDLAQLKGNRGVARLLTEARDESSDVETPIRT